RLLSFRSGQHNDQFHGRICDICHSGLYGPHFKNAHLFGCRVGPRTGVRHLSKGTGHNASQPYMVHLFLLDVASSGSGQY
ncbi:hypothetical protein X801_08340, partial [Opisthorchis viverrini]